MKKNVWLIVLFFTYIFCFAQDEDNSFWAGVAKPAGFGKPFWAEMHSTLNGINPYGQFRSMPHFQQIGIAAIFE